MHLSSSTIKLEEIQSDCIFTSITAQVSVYIAKTSFLRIYIIRIRIRLDQITRPEIYSSPWILLQRIHVFIIHSRIYRPLFVTFPPRLTRTVIYTSPEYFLWIQHWLSIWFQPPWGFNNYFINAHYLYLLIFRDSYYVCLVLYTLFKYNIIY